MKIVRYESALDAGHWQLLLEADPWREAVEAYLAVGEVWLTEAGDGIAVVQALADGVWEIKNIALAEGARGQGRGKAFLRALVDMLGKRGARAVEIGTGNSSLGQLALYQKLGFRIVGIIPDFFVPYPEPIIENGLTCRDMIRLRLNL